jgi:hypothetical protein
MDIKIQIDAVIHVHIHDPGNLSGAIDKINQAAADTAAETVTINSAVKTAEGQTP